MTDISRDAVAGQALRANPAGETSTAYRNYTLVILTLAFIANVVDRQILSIMLQPIKQDLGISDAYLGLLTGVSFGIFYAVLGIPIAIWADRGNRRNIVTLSLVIFSGFTILCGGAANFIQLLLARIGVAAGEAGSSPPSHSMIADIFPLEKRTAALGFFSAATNIGTLIGFFVGGWIYQLYGWRAAFFIIGAPGLLIALLVRFTLKEPVRGHADNLKTEGAKAAPSLKEVFSFLGKQKAFIQLTCGTALCMTGGTACFGWMPSFLARSFEMAPHDAGITLALFLGVIGGVGIFTNSNIANKLGKRDTRWNLWTLAIVNLLSTPFWIGMYLSHDKSTALLFFIFPAFMASTWTAIVFSMTQALAPIRMRTRAAAVLYLAMNLIGGGLGPYLIGVISDALAPTAGQESLRYAMMIISLTFPWSAIHFFIAAHHLKKDIVRANEYAAA